MNPANILTGRVVSSSYLLSYKVIHVPIDNLESIMVKPIHEEILDVNDFTAVPGVIDIHMYVFFCIDSLKFDE
ncbi:MAG: hypothetical protein QXQ46_08965 [Thermoplasmatales archaeon]